MSRPVAGEEYRVASGACCSLRRFPFHTADSFVAVVRATEAAVTVIDRYAQQFREAGLETEQRTEIKSGTIPASKVRLTTAGGGDGTITAALAPDGQTYLLIERCDD